jgi:hypothetical protein
VRLPACLQFDYVIGMDDTNLASIRRAAEHWRREGGGSGSGGAVPPEDCVRKLSLMTDYLRSQQYSKYSEVPGECTEWLVWRGMGEAWQRCLG